MLKAAIKHSTSEDQVRHRAIPPDVVSKWASKLEDMKGELAEILEEEKEEKKVRTLDAIAINSETMFQLRQAEMELNKGINIMEHEAEIYSRPARTWFQSGKEKKEAEGMLQSDTQLIMVDLNRLV